MSISTALKAVGASLLALIVSIGIAIALGHYVPRVVGGPGVAPQPGRVYTLEEVNRAEREAKARMEQHAREFALKPARDVLAEFLQHALPGLWLPWLTLPLLLPIKSIAQAFLVVALPVLGAAGLGAMEVAAAVAIAFAIGVSARHLLIERKRAT